MPFILIELTILNRGSLNDLWYSISFSAVLSLIVCAVIVFVRYGKGMFPFLIPRDRDDSIFIYDYRVSEQAAAEMSLTAVDILNNAGYSKRLQTLTGLCIEEITMLISEKNPSAGKSILAECTLILNDSGLQLILRDSGVIFDISNEDSLPDSFRQFVVSNMMSSITEKIYLVTTGYNRIGLKIKEDQAVLP